MNIKTNKNTFPITNSFILRKELNDRVIKHSPPLFIQPKLTKRAPDDMYEKAADAMADKIMRMSMPDENERFRFEENRN